MFPIRRGGISSRGAGHRQEHRRDFMAGIGAGPGRWDAPGAAVRPGHAEAGAGAGSGRWGQAGGGGGIGGMDIMVDIIVSAPRKWRKTGTRLLRFFYGLFRCPMLQSAKNKGFSRYLEAKI